MLLLTGHMRSIQSGKLKITIARHIVPIHELPQFENVLGVFTEDKWRLSLTKLKKKKV